MIAASHGATVIAVDIAASSLALALRLGASSTVDASLGAVAEQVRDLTDGGADVSLDALGSTQTMRSSLRCLRRRGRHVQVGLLVGADALPVVPMDLVIGSELQVLGSHGMSAADYPGMLAEIADGRLRPHELVRDRIRLAAVPDRLAALSRADAGAGGITAIRPQEA